MVKNAPELQLAVICLGAFYTVRSFLGSFGQFMSESGLLSWCRLYKPIMLKHIYSLVKQSAVLYEDIYLKMMQRMPWWWLETFTSSSHFPLNKINKMPYRNVIYRQCPLTQWVYLWVKQNDISNQTKYKYMYMFYSDWSSIDVMCYVSFNYEFSALFQGQFMLTIKTTFSKLWRTF